MDATNWTIRKADSGKEYGNLTLDTLKIYVIEGRIEPNDLVKNDRMANWVPATDIEDLKIMLGSIVPRSSSSATTISSADFQFFWNTQEDDEIELDMTPMIDCIFLLLIFFLVTANFAVHEIKNIQVPKAGYTALFKQERLTVSIDKDRKIYLGKIPIELSSLREQLKQKVSEVREQDLVLVADKSIDYGFIIAVLDQINGAGLNNVKLKLEKKK